MVPYLLIKSTSSRHILWGQFSPRCDRLNLWTSSLKSMRALTESEVWNWVYPRWNCWCSFKFTVHFASRKIYPIWHSNPKNLSSPDCSALSWKLQKAHSCMLNYLVLHFSTPFYNNSPCFGSMLVIGTITKKEPWCVPIYRPPQKEEAFQNRTEDRQPCRWESFFLCQWRHTQTLQPIRREYHLPFSSCLLGALTTKMG